MKQERLDLVKALTTATVGVLYYFSIKKINVLNMLKGHTYVDQWLEQVTTNLVNEFKGQGSIYRLATNEYSLLIPTVSEDHLSVVNRLESIIHLNSHEAAVIIYTGVVPLKDDIAPDESIRKGYGAMTLNKSSEAHAPFDYYDDVEFNTYTRRSMLEQELRYALQHDQLSVVYQPIVHPMTGQLGFEALSRWKSPVYGDVPPMDFIPIAEEIGFIHELTYFVLEAVINQLQTYPEIDYVSINLSAKTFEDPMWYVKLKDLINQVDSRRIIFELTETCLINPLHHYHIKMLQEEGHKIFIDDFGTGYSSIALLIELGINGVKLDRFFCDYTEALQYRPVVTKTVEMAKALNLHVIIEGVEKAQQKVFFTELGCDGIQGYLESRPMQAESIPTYLRNIVEKDTAR